MFPDGMQRWARGTAEAVATPLARMGMTPNTLTVLGFAFNVATAIVLATGHLSTAGALLFVSGVFDMLDGALARVAGSQSDFGAFLDSLLDRYSEAAILLAVIFVFTVRQNTPAVILAYAAAVGSILISYARARAEGLGVECRVGIAPRPERVLILGLGLLFNGTTTIVALGLLALLTHITAMQRLYHVWQQTHARNKEKKSGRAAKRESTPM